MKVSFALILLSGLAFASAGSRSKRAAYDLPDGAELIVGDVRTTFVCSDNGYYADMDNNCQIFHVCHEVVHNNGAAEMFHWSFLCGNQTVFNQLSFTCASPEHSVPCPSSSDFYYLNANLRAGPDVNLHDEQDVDRAAAVIPGRPPIVPQSRFVG
ncbi:chitin-binding type-2 domain-containing protein [Caerostris darwini]|uniref:Chitin-binding type-2 domain-containing protein n=1 Tax=Caerostris darwini TaxID=1538125 RepID=A0AAV4QRY0_9ARAC|nr:chitin-binding type-2 domain-containing protein [Caerostris darwini]